MVLKPLPASSAVNVGATDGGPPRTNAVQRIGVNFASLLASDVFSRGVTFVIYAMVARYSGAYAFGQLSLGLMLLFSFQVFASIGLPTLLFRDIAKSPDKDGKYLTNAFVVCFASSLICYALLAGFVWASGYASDTSLVVLLFGLSILPWSLSLVTDAVFRAHEKMYLTLCATIPVNLSRFALVLGFLSIGYGVQAVAWVLLASHFATLSIHLCVLLFGLRVRLMSFEWSFAKKLFQDSLRFFGIDAFIAIASSINVVLLSWFADELAVGVFGAALQLLLPPRITFQAIVTSLFPIMCRRAANTSRKSPELTVRILEVLLFFAIPGCVLLWYCASPLVAMIYRDDGFDSSSLLVRIMIPSLLFGAVTRVLGQVLMSNCREGINLRIVAIDLVFNTVVGLLLISEWGAVGAAITVLLTGMLDSALHVIATRDDLFDRNRRLGLPPLTISWHTLVAAGLMAVTLSLTGTSSFWWQVALGSITFLLGFALLVRASQPQSGSLRDHFLSPFGEGESA